MIHEAEALLEEFVAYVRDAEQQNDILTLYLVVDPADRDNQGPTPAWRIYMQNALADIENQLDPRQTKQWKTVRLTDSADHTKWARVRLRLENFVSGYRPTGKTLVLFIGPNGELAYELPIRLQNRVHYGWPQMTEFLWAIDEYEQYLVVLFAQDRARAVTMFLGHSADEVVIDLDQSWQRRERKSLHHHQMARRQAEVDRRFARYAAGQVDELFMEADGIERVIFGGNIQMAHAVRSYMHPTVADQVIAMLPVHVDAPAQDIAAAIRDVAEAYEREFERLLVDEITNRARAGGRGALGLEAVRQALDRQAVSLLVLPYPLEAAVTDELFLKAVYSGSDVEFVEGEAAHALEEVGGIAARLYYAV